MDQPGTSRIGPAGSGVCALVTGATGLLGSHLVERLKAQGDQVRALVRTDSRTDFLDALGVEIVRGDLTDPASCAAASPASICVFHCAAKVGDWGSWREFQTGCLDATETLARAAMQAGVGRFLHISSTSAYGHPSERKTPIDETAALGENVWVLDYYTRSKVECERLLWRMAESEGLPLTVIRPSWLFGERDRTTAPRLIREFRRGRMMIVGKGDNPLSVPSTPASSPTPRSWPRAIPAHAVRRTTSRARAAITQREFLDLFADALKVPRVRRHVPYPLAFTGGSCSRFGTGCSGASDRRGSPVTGHGFWAAISSTAPRKLASRLGWQPAIGYAESIERTLDWFLNDEARSVECGSKGNARATRCI